MKNGETVIVGGDHHNTLAAIRDLGRNGYSFILIIHSCNNKIKVIHSRYVRQYYVVDESEESLLVCLKRIASSKKRYVLPCSDLAAYTIDRNYSELSNSYLIPGFKNKRGLVASLMDKYSQGEFFDSIGIESAKTYILGDCVKDNNIELPFPCIIKPRVSAFGQKSQITIIQNKSDFESFLDKIQVCNLDTYILQEFKEKKYEICSYGCLTENAFADGLHSKGCIIKKIRETKTGSTCFAMIISESADLYREEDLNTHKSIKTLSKQELTSIKKVNSKLLRNLYLIGFRGEYDIEYLVCEEGIYVNEINFRQSGNGYALPSYGISIPCIVVDDSFEDSHSFNSINDIPLGKYHMDENSDIFNINIYKLKPYKWAIQYLTTKAKAIFSFSDLPGTFVFYWSNFKYIVKQFLKRACK
jgi:D-aspartate ligase